MQKIPIKEKRNQSTKKKYNKRPNSKSHIATKDIIKRETIKRRTRMDTTTI